MTTDSVEPPEGTWLGIRILDAAKILQPHLAPAGQRDLGLGQLGDRLGASERADRLLLPADLATPAREIDIGRPHLPVDLASGDAERQQPVRIERDPDFAIDTAVALDPADALQPLQLARDDIVDMPGELLESHAGRGRAIGQDRLALDVDALDHRLVDGARQIRPDLGDGILDVVDSAVGIGFEPELDQRQRLPVGQRRGDVLDAGNIGDRILDALGDLAFELGWSGAGLRHRHRDQRNVDVREARDRQLREGEQAKHAQHDEEQDRGNRLSDRPGGEVDAHRPPRQFVATGVIRSPSRTKVPARATTVSPAARPLAISARPPPVRPSVTLRVLILPFWTVCTVGSLRV